MAAYPITWLSDSKFDISNKFRDPENLKDDNYI